MKKNDLCETDIFAKAVNIGYSVSSKKYTASAVVT